jgi:hypothetical protein
MRMANRGPWDRFWCIIALAFEGLKRSSSLYVPYAPMEHLNQHYPFLSPRTSKGILCFNRFPSTILEGLAAFGYRPPAH